MSALSIGSSAIRQIDGLYSLNDLHVASGSAEKDRPSHFLRNDQTKALVSELENVQICAFKILQGRNGGTYACKELVIAYAAWISPAFHLKVIRVFLAEAGRTLQVPETITKEQQGELSTLICRALSVWQRQTACVEPVQQSFQTGQLQGLACKPFRGSVRIHQDHAGADASIAKTICQFAGQGLFCSGTRHRQQVHRRLVTRSQGRGCPPDLDHTG